METDARIIQAAQCAYQTQGEAARQVADEQMRPSMMLRPQLSVDGDQWCALYGENLQDGVAGFGDSPEEAYADFDKNWRRKLEKRKSYCDTGNVCRSCPDAALCE